MLVFAQTVTFYLILTGSLPYYLAIIITLVVLYCLRVWSRLVPIMLLKLPIMVWSNAPEFSLLCSNYAPLCSTNSTFSFSYHT